MKLFCFVVFCVERKTTRNKWTWRQRGLCWRRQWGTVPCTCRPFLLPRTKGGWPQVIPDSGRWRFPLCRTPSSVRGTLCTQTRATTIATQTPLHKVHMCMLLQASKTFIFRPLNSNMKWYKFNCISLHSVPHSKPTVKIELFLENLTNKLFERFCEKKIKIAERKIWSF